MPRSFPWRCRLLCRYARLRTTLRVVFGIGFRELVALGVLAIALLMGFLFFDPTSTESGSGTPGTISLGNVPPTGTPRPAGTPTPAPVHTVAQPAGQWFITYYERGASGSDLRTGEGFVPSLDIDIEDRPFLDMKPDAWSIKVSSTVEVGEGRSRFALEVDGATKVWVDDLQVAEAANGDKPVRLDVEFEHKAGKASLTIEVRDTGGPVKLRWAD